MLRPTIIVWLEIMGLAATRGEPPTVSERAQSQTIQRLVIDAEGLDRAPLREAVALRLPGRELLNPGKAPPSPFGFLRVRPGETGAKLELILSDGRAYYRTVDFEEGEDRARAIATVVANLVAGIEEDRVEPDARDVPMPVIVPAAPPRPTPKPAPKPVPATRTLEVGVLAHGGPVLGLGPPAPAGLAAGGGEIDARVRMPSGLAASFGVRASGRMRDCCSLARVRLAAGVGYVWRRGRFELATDVRFALEPFVAIRDGRRTDLSGTTGGDSPPSLLLGGHARVAPGVRVPVDRAKSLALRVAPVLELGGSAVPEAGGGAARVSTQPAVGERIELFRAGGLELAIGIEIGVWIVARRLTSG